MSEKWGQGGRCGHVFVSPKAPKPHVLCFGICTLAESYTLQLGQGLMLQLPSTQVDWPWFHLNNQFWVIASSHLEVNLSPSRQHSALWQEMSKVITES